MGRKTKTIPVGTVFTSAAGSCTVLGPGEPYDAPSGQRLSRSVVRCACGDERTVLNYSLLRAKPAVACKACWSRYLRESGLNSKASKKGAKKGGVASRKHYPDLAPGMKRCSKCKMPKPADEAFFPRRHVSVGGPTYVNGDPAFSAWCHACRDADTARRRLHVAAQNHDPEGCRIIYEVARQIMVNVGGEAAWEIDHLWPVVASRQRRPDEQLTLDEVLMFEDKAMGIHAPWNLFPLPRALNRLLSDRQPNEELPPLKIENPEADDYFTPFTSEAVEVLWNDGSGIPTAAERAVILEPLRQLLPWTRPDGTALGCDGPCCGPAGIRIVERFRLAPRQRNRRVFSPDLFEKAA